jgi:hypothetical protein
MAERRIKMLNNDLDKLKLEKIIGENDILTDMATKGIQFNETIDEISFVHQIDNIIEEENNES